MRVQDLRIGNWINDCDDPSLNIIIDGKYITCVEFVHELQNIVYYLTGKELQ